MFSLLFLFWGTISNALLGTLGKVKFILFFALFRTFVLLSWLKQSLGCITVEIKFVSA
jgi:hypothetical protein